MSVFSDGLRRPLWKGHSTLKGVATYRLRISTYTAETTLGEMKMLVVFVFDFKMGRKAEEKTRDMGDGPNSTSSVRIVQWWPSNKSRKGDKRLEDEGHSGQSSALTATDWQQPSKPILFPLERSHQWTQHGPFKAVWHLKHIGELKKLMNASWADWKSNRRIIYVTQQQAISLLNCDIWGPGDLIRQPGMTGYGKAFSTTKHAPDKGLGHSLVACCQSHFLKRHHCMWGVCSIGEMHPKLHRLQFAWDNSKWSVLFHKKTWMYVTHQALQKLNESKCCFTCHIHLGAPTFHHVFEHLDNVLHGTDTLPQPASCRTGFLRVRGSPRQGFVCYLDKRT